MDRTNIRMLKTILGSLSRKLFSQVARTLTQESEYTLDHQILTRLSVNSLIKSSKTTMDTSQMTNMSPQWILQNLMLPRFSLMKQLLSRVLESEWQGTTQMLDLDQVSPKKTDLSLLIDSRKL